MLSEPLDLYRYMYCYWGAQSILEIDWEALSETVIISRQVIANIHIHLLTILWDVIYIRSSCLGLVFLFEKLIVQISEAP